MLFFGHRFIKSKEFYHIYSIEAILSTPPSSILYIEFDENNLDLISYAMMNNMPFAIYASSAKEIVYASTFQASYIIVDKNIAKLAQEIADNYLFDAKILTLINDEEDIEDMAMLGVDGVIFPEAIVKVTK